MLKLITLQVCEEGTLGPRLTVARTICSESISTDVVGQEGITEASVLGSEDRDCVEDGLADGFVEGCCDGFDDGVSIGV